MLVELSSTQIILANCLGIPLAHLGISWFFEKLPRRLFHKDISSAKPRLICKHLFLIHHWKQHLPDGAPWFNGFPKAKLASSDPPYLATFITETRRGELAHWIQWIVISLFIFWNPYPANLIILGYALLANLPCILNLRHTRKRLITLYLRKTKAKD